jgi:hypothetical protein
VLSFHWAPCHEVVLGEWRYSSAHSLTSTLDGGEWSASRPSRFTSGERAPGTHLMGGWVCPRAVLGAVAKRKIPSLRQESNPRTLIVQPVAQRYADWAITALSHLESTTEVYQNCVPKTNDTSVAFVCILKENVLRMTHIHLTLWRRID